MNKKILIISPYFPPSNAADMQRVRMSLPYFKQFGWDATVVTVDEKYLEMLKDKLLLHSIPAGMEIYKVKAFDKKITSKFGLGSLALRSMWHYRRKVNELLKLDRYDLIYFSTTEFPVCILGRYWKKKFNVPYVIDFQDPWHSDYYENKPKEQRPKKYWFSYRLNKYLEAAAIRQTAGLISVSQAYIDDLKMRYFELKKVPDSVITFGAFKPDMEIAKKNGRHFPRILGRDTINIVYVGRGGMDMHMAVAPLFKALKLGLQNDTANFRKLKLYFIGTSYAPQGQGIETISPLAKQEGVGSQVVEYTDRISYYHTLCTLQQADALFMPGSDDPNYTASKIYPYLLVNKPILAIFNRASSAIKILQEYGAPHVYDYESVAIDAVYQFLSKAALNQFTPEHYDQRAIAKYSAEQMTQKQCLLFEKAINFKKPVKHV